MEALDALAEWLNKSCARPPRLAALDVRKNEVPLGLYAAASIGGLSAPSLYLIDSDVEKKSVGIRWAGEIHEFEGDQPPRKKGALEKSTTLLRAKLNQILPWVLEHSRRYRALSVPETFEPEQGGAFRSQEAPVLELGNEKELQQLLERNVTGYMEFFSPSCGACKKFAPTYESAARKAPNFTFARVDCSTPDGERSCNKHGIDKYPSLFLMQGGRLEKYPGGPKRHQLLEYLETQTSPPWRDFQSQEEAIAFAKKKRLLLWAGDRNANFEAVLTAANEMRQQVSLGKVDADKESLSLLAPSRKEVAYQGPYQPEDLQLWLAEQLVRSAPIPPETETQASSSPVRTVVGANFRQKVFKPLEEGKHVLLEVYAPWCGHCKKLAPIYEQFAQKMQDEGRPLVVAKLDGDANGIPFAGFDYTGFPTLFYLSPSSEQITKVSERTLEGLVSFVTKMGVSKPGEASKPSLSQLLSQFRSEEPPAKQTSPVRTVVLSNFVDVVFHEQKHCLLMLYDQKCPHCMRMMPELEAFAQELKRIVVVAKMDGTKNDLPMTGFEVKGFPTLFFIEAGHKEPSMTQIGSNALVATKRLLERQKEPRRRSQTAFVAVFAGLALWERGDIPRPSMHEIVTYIWP
ncbi:unnamed protein product [Durusdinium trenchii]|uniref:protein disulfide-isomerase n=1 Tax=Durusdinium trenchii TaxID=1381693 RepID=A0ABP0QAF6_9DINO